jgi:hypothetical protein
MDAFIQFLLDLMGTDSEIVSNNVKKLHIKVERGRKYSVG